MIAAGIHLGDIQQRAEQRLGRLEGLADVVEQPAGAGVYERRSLQRRQVEACRVQRLQEVVAGRSEEHTSELQSLMRISYAVFCLKKKKNTIGSNNKQLD